MTPRVYAERAWTRQHVEVPGVVFAHVEDTDRAWKLVFESFYIGHILAAPGRPRYRLRGHDLRLEAGDINLTEPGDAVACEAGSAGGASVSFFIPADRVVQAAREIDSSIEQVRFPATKVRDEQLAQLVRDCAEAFEESAAVLERQSLFDEMLQHTLRSHCTHGPMEDPPAETSAAPGDLDRVVALINARLADPITLDELAEAAGLTRFKLLRAFKRRFALPPHEYQVKARLARAQELLRDGAPIAEAAEATGFADQSHFTRHFKRTYSVTPGDFWKRKG